jgi:hypothetical protein
LAHFTTLGDGHRFAKDDLGVGFSHWSHVLVGAYAHPGRAPRVRLHAFASKYYMFVGGQRKGVQGAGVEGDGATDIKTRKIM